jgi:hypothetical protein
MFAFISKLKNRIIHDCGSQFYNCGSRFYSKDDCIRSLVQVSSRALISRTSAIFWRDLGSVMTIPNNPETILDIVGPLIVSENTSFITLDSSKIGWCFMTSLQYLNKGLIFLTPPRDSILTISIKSLLKNFSTSFLSKSCCCWAISASVSICRGVIPEHPETTKANNTNKSGLANFKIFIFTSWWKVKRIFFIMPTNNIDNPLLYISYCGEYCNTYFLNL